MNQETTLNLKQAMNDRSFVTLLINAQTPEEAQQVFASRNILFSLDEVKAIGTSLRLHAENGEIDDELLNQISGGVALSTVAAAVSIAASTIKIVDFAGKRLGWWK